MIIIINRCIFSIIWFYMVTIEEFICLFNSIYSLKDTRSLCVDITYLWYEEESFIPSGVGLRKTKFVN
jgi:hypothetical protein